MVAGLAYGGYWLSGHVFGGGSTTASSAGGDVPGAIDRSIAAGFGAIGNGLGMRNLHDQYQVRDDIDRAIDTVRQERTTLDAAVGTVTGARADALSAAIFAEGALEAALGQWRDVIFNLRFGQIDQAQTAVADSLAALGKARDAWNAAGGSS